MSQNTEIRVIVIMVIVSIWICGYWQQDTISSGYKENHVSLQDTIYTLKTQLQVGKNKIT